MQWPKGKGAWFLHALFLAADVGLAVDWAMPTDGLLSMLRFGVAEYVAAMFFFGCCAMIVIWEPVSDLRPSRKFRKLQSEIVETRDTIVISTRGKVWDHPALYTSIEELRYRLGKLGIKLLEWEKMQDVGARIVFAKFLTQLGSFAEFSEIDAARKLYSRIDAERKLQQESPDSKESTR